MSGLTAEQVETIQSKCKSALDQLVDPRAKVIAEQTIALCDLALAQLRARRQEPVAWMWIEGVELLNGTEVEQFERVELSRDKPADDAYCLTPLYSAPQPAQAEQDALRQQSGAGRDADTPSGFIKPDTSTHVYFYEQDHYYLSNFSAFSLLWRGIRFATSEQAYHWERFIYTRDKDAIIKANSAHEAYRYAQDNKQHQRAGWDEIKVEVMRDILRAKVHQHEYVRRKLLATGPRILVEDSWRDSFWGWGPNRDGQNMLGKLWMEVRADLLAAIKERT